MDIETKIKKKRPPQKRTKCPVKYSNWFITINSQKNINSMNEEEFIEFKTNFENVINSFFEPEKLASFVIASGSKQGETFGMPKDVPREELLKRVEDAYADYTYEVGSEKNRYHCHALFSIKKRGLDTKLDYDGIRKYIDYACGYTCHINFRLYNNAGANLLEYMKK